MALMVAVVFPVLVMVNTCGAEAVPVDWLPKLKAVGAHNICAEPELLLFEAAPPVPETAMLLGDVGALL
jgi:hypothetical protein